MRLLRLLAAGTGLMLATCLAWGLLLQVADAVAHLTRRRDRR